MAGVSVLALAGAPVLAQEDAPAPTPIEVAEEEEEEASSDERVVVTGSRIRRDTFSSIAPLQVITADSARDIGLVDPGLILQTSEAAAGQQIDSTFQGFVLDNGPGSETVNLRGLGASRTLVLLNGRRLAPAGVEGAPQSPSINILPGTLVERYDLLLDGASSVYGSDAIAGVGNVVLRQDFDGLELEFSADDPERGAGRDYTISGVYGLNTDRGFVGFGAEYDFQEAVSFNDREFLDGCETEYEITESGEIRTLGIDRQLRYETFGQFYPEQECVLSGLGRRIRRVPGGLGFVYYTPGTTNVGIPNFSEEHSIQRSD